MAVDLYGNPLPPVTTGTPPPIPMPGQTTVPAPVAPTTFLSPQSFNMASMTAPRSTPYPFANRDYNTMLQESLEKFMDPNSQYIQNARQRGIEMAATRGGVNSSIAAGASERAALEAAVPLAQTAVGMQAGAEQAQIQNWLNEQGFNRELAAMPFTNSLQMLGRVTELGMQDPELYTPSVVSGFTNFFNQQMNDMISRYFSGG